MAVDDLAAQGTRALMTIVLDLSFRNYPVLTPEWSILLAKYHGFWKVHDDVIKWKHFPRYWPLVRGIHRSPVNSPNKGQWRGAFMFSVICVCINGWVNNREAGDLRHYRAHYDVTVMLAVLMEDSDYISDTDAGVVFVWLRHFQNAVRYSRCTYISMIYGLIKRLLVMKNYASKLIINKQNNRNSFLRFWSSIDSHFFFCFFNTLRPRQNGRHSPDDIFKCIFLNENIWIVIAISL